MFIPRWKQVLAGYSQTFKTMAAEGEEIILEKLVSMATSRDPGC